MTTRTTRAVYLAAMAVFGLTVALGAVADTSRSQKRTSNLVRVCLAAATTHFDYSDAVRVVHWVDGLYQRNLGETDLIITTNVYSKCGDIARTYETTCTTDSFGKVANIAVTTAF